MSSSLVPPHGGILTPRLAPPDEVKERLEHACRLPKIPLSSREVSDLLMIGMGAFSPLTGFMCRQDYLSSTFDMQLSDGTLWPIPITLTVDDALAKTIKDGQTVALVDGETGETVGTMDVQEKYTYSKRDEVLNVYRTDDEAHPGVAKVFSQGEVCLGGPVTVLSECGYPERFPEYARPHEVRAIFQERGWSTVVAFQTRNPIHRSHEFITKVALEMADGLFIHPIVGRLKEGDIPAEVRMKCYRALLEGYYPKDRVVLKVYPMEMRYAGPREAVLHAIIRQNFGCSHLCVGRDHAGVGNYYGPFDAQKIFDEIPPNKLVIRPIKFENAFWCRVCGSMATAKTCPHPREQHLSISGTKLREMLSSGEMPPPEFSRPEVVKILMDYYRSLAD
jgi:sulfate adenylyltransferase